jgi:hypothetical protein
MRPLAARRSGGLAALILLAATPASADGEVSFTRDVVPILNKHCVMCHMVGSELGGLSLYPDPRGNLVDMRSTQCGLNLVEPGKPDSSYLLIKILGKQSAAGGKGREMPWDYALDERDIDLIRRWIAQGAGDN